eukprot:90579_1
MSEPTDREIRAQRRETQQQIDDALAQQRSEFEEKIKEKENETETQMAKFSAERSQMMEMMHALQQQLNNMNLNHHPQPQKQKEKRIMEAVATQDKYDMRRFKSMNANRTSELEFEEGDYVLHFIGDTMKGNKRKMNDKWIGPYRIKTKLNKYN